jgi:hypothetical protein
VAAAVVPASAIYTREGDAFVPTELARGPWDPTAQHGGAPASLLARAVEGEVEALRIARLTYEFLRPVPLAPLAVSARTVRPGRRVRLVEAEIQAEGETVCRVVGLALAHADGTAPAVAPAGAPLPAPDSAGASPDGPPGRRPMFGGDGVELRFVRGRFAEPGPAAAWLRLRVPLVEGEDPSPVQRAAAAADFGNGVSAALDWNEYVFINADLTIHLVREPWGEWVGLDARTAVEPDGVGLSQSVIHDARGPIGSAAQSLLVGPRA